MSTPRWKQIVRRFPENGMKLLLEDPRNVRDLLTLSGSDLLPLIDFDHLRLTRTTFVARDYRHIEADVVMTAPLRVKAGERGRRMVWLYILLEHQSTPDPLMSFRLLEYLVQVLKAQMREWSRTHRSFAGFRFQPVLPVVFYTGTERWDRIATLIDLTELGTRFTGVIPVFEPIFLNLPALPAEHLTEDGGYFGWVLRLIQGRRSRAQDFRQLLDSAIAALEAMPAAERLRWLELLSYVLMLVYHERDESEHRGLREAVESSVQTDRHRQEMRTMGRTIAEAMKAEARKEGRKEGRVMGRKEEAIRVRQQTLLRQLRAMFGEPPEATVQAIHATHDVDQLDSWLDQVVRARTLRDLGIGRPS